MSLLHLFDRARPTTHCPAGASTRVVLSFAVALPRTYELTVWREDDGPLVGELEERRSWWIFPRKPRFFPLQPTMSLRRGILSSIYELRVRPEVDTRVDVD